MYLPLGTRHADDEGGPYFIHIVDHLAEILGKGHLASGEQGKIIAGCSLEGMRKGQEGQHHMGVLYVFAEIVGYLPGVRNEIIMRKHDSLRVSRCAGGINEGGEILGPDGLEPSS